MDPNISPGKDALLSLKLDHGVQCYTKVSIMQLIHLKVSQPKLRSFSPQVWLGWKMPRPTRMPDGGGKATSKLMQSALSPGQGLEDEIEKCRGRLITVTRNNNDSRISGTTITRKQKWEEKQLYGRFKRLTSNISHEKTWTWLRNGNLKRETESLLIPA